MQKLRAAGRRRNGFTIVQVLVAAAILGILTLALLTILNTSLKQERQLRLAKEAREFSTELRASTRMQNCGIAELAHPMDVKDTHWTHDVIYPLAQGLDGRLLQLKAGSKYGPFEVDKIQIEAWQNPTGPGRAYVAVDGGNDADFDRATTVRGALSVALKGGGWNGKAIQSPVYLLLDATKRKIIGCSADMTALTALPGGGGAADAASSGSAIDANYGGGTAGPPGPGSADFTIAPAVTTSPDSGMVTTVRTIPDPMAPPPAPEEKHDDKPCRTPEECSVMQQQMKDMLDDE